MTRLSNSLTDLADKVKEANRLCDLAQRTSAAKAIETGELLAEAKDNCKHGEWLPFLSRAEIPERQAQRLMKLARTGLTSDAVSDLGGITGAIEWAKGFRLPLPGEVLFVSLDAFEPGRNEPHAYVWWKKEGYHIVMFDLNEATPHTMFTQRPVRTERGVRLSIYRLLDYRYAEMTFQVISEEIHRHELDELYEVADRSRRANV